MLLLVQISGLVSSGRVNWNDTWSYLAHLLLLPRGSLARVLLLLAIGGLGSLGGGLRIDTYGSRSTLAVGLVMFNLPVSWVQVFVDLEPVELKLLP